MDLPTRTLFIITLFFLHLNFSVYGGKNNEYMIIGLFPIKITSVNESKEVILAANDYKKQYLPPNASIDIQLHNGINQASTAMKIMLETFTQPQDLAGPGIKKVIIGPGDSNAIDSVDQFLQTIPQKVLYLVYNPVISTKKYLHNMAPSVLSVVKLVIELMLDMKWNYIAIMKDSTEFSTLCCDLLQKELKKKRICIGLIKEINFNEESILQSIKDANIKGVLVFGKEDTVRSVSRKKINGAFRFIFISDENLKTKNTQAELPNMSMMIFFNNFYNGSHLKYIYDSVHMALIWFNLCQNLSTCRDLKQEEVIMGSLDIYQKIEQKLYMVGSYNKKMILNSKLNKVPSFCQKECEKCRMLDNTPNTYILKNGTYYIVFILTLHKNNENDPFACSHTLSLSDSIDLIEAALFAIKTSAFPDLGLIIVDSCRQPIVTTEQIIRINYANVIGVIGGFYSLITIPAAEVLTRLQIPQISYGAESHVLSDTDRFPYFQRTIVSMDEKSKAVILLCKQMGWKAINIMYNKEPYGISGRLLLMKYAKMHDICIVNDISVELGELNFQIYLNQLRKTRKVKVVITFFLRSSQLKWLTVLNDDLERNEFFFIETYGVSEVNFRSILPKEFDNEVTIEFNKPINLDFIKYVKNLQKSEIEMNPWAKEFIEEKYKCRFENSFNTAYTRSCKYQLPENSITTYHDLIIKAVYALINGTLHASNNFNNFKNIDAKKISEEIRKTKLNISGKIQRLFDDDGKTQIQSFSLLKVKKVNPLEYEKVATYEDDTWQSTQWNEFSFTSVCEAEDFCTVCPEKTDNTLFTVFLVLTLIMVVLIIGIIGVFIWKTKHQILQRFTRPRPESS